MLSWNKGGIVYALLAFTYKADAGNQEIVKKCLSFLEQEVKIYNIPNHRVEDVLKDNSVVITFGKFAELAVQHFIFEKKLGNVRHEKMPAPKQLVKSELNKDFRVAALETLKKIKEFMAQDILKPEVKVFEEGDLPDLDHKQLLLLQKIVEESKKGFCYQTTKNGKLIEIGVTHQPNSKADIQISFEELFILRLIMDVLGTEKVELVTSSTAGHNFLPNKKVS